ncbi:hypothetical protein [Streptomyces sp. PR69]|uniref:hypothetical protein n=1 Tax=Streptomyces sp. PR69 TaxID=2984950 RepID=UPI0022641E13|nr:hypothetical protein [Streptomyces sp. PR69]
MRSLLIRRWTAALAGVGVVPLLWWGVQAPSAGAAAPCPRASAPPSAGDVRAAVRQQPPDSFTVETWNMQGATASGEC